MLNSLLKLFGYKAVRLSSLLSVEENLAAFAVEMESQRDVCFTTEDEWTRFSLSEALRGAVNELVEDIYSGKAQNVRDSAAFLAVVAMDAALDFGELLPRPEQA